MDKNHYWCNVCQIPLIKEVCLNCGNKGHEISHEIKPVFKEEYEYYKEAAKRSYTVNQKFFPKILYRQRNYLISDGTDGNNQFRIKVRKNVSLKDIKLLKAGEFKIQLIDVGPQRRSHLHKFFLEDRDYMEKLIKGNQKYIEELENEAINFIKETSLKFSKYYKICSFSGGKDSTVTANLVKKAIGNVPIVYSNTGIEFPETIDYVEKYGNNFGDLLHLKPQVKFMDICKKLGPPSRTMRWCCFTCKGAPLSKYYSNMEHENVLSFDGIRKLESQARAKYDRAQDNTKYKKQYSAYPILEWSTLEIWLYIFMYKLPYNKLYDHGFARVGCWACPNNTLFDWFLLSKVHPEMIKKWFEFLNDYRNEQSKKMEGDGYDFSWVEDGDWKKRRVKYKNEDNLANITQNQSSKEFELVLNNSTKTNLSEFFKVFGKNNEENLSSGVKTISIQNKNIEINYIEGKKSIRFKILNEKKEKELKKLVARQINKSFNCINCGACVGSCSQGAISINPHFHIDPETCTNCLICTGTKYIDMSCIAIHYKEDRIYIKLNSI